MLYRSPSESRLFHGQPSSGQKSVLSQAKLSAFFHTPTNIGGILHKNNARSSADSVFNKAFGKRIAIIFGISTILFVPVLATFLYFGSHLHSSSYIGGYKLPSQMNKAEAEVASKANAIVFEIKNSDGSVLKPTAEQLGLKFDTAKSFAELKSKQNGSGLAARLMFWKKQQVDVSYSIDDAKLNQYFAEYINQSTVPAKDATLEIKSSEPTIVDEINGQTTGIDGYKQSIDASAKTLANVSLTSTKFDVPAKVTKKDLEDDKAKIAAILATDQQVVVSGSTVNVPRSTLASWLVLRSTDQGKNYRVFADDSLVSAYVQKIIAPYVAPPKARTVVTDATTGEERVLVEGRNGSDVVNSAAIVNGLISSVDNARSSKQEVEIAFANFKTVKATEADKWLEVDLTNKRMYAYEKNTLIKTFLISAGAPATPTVKGTYTIQTKVRKQDMKGRNADGSGYFQPNVEYVNYFYQDYAIHGNYWRTWAFGNTNASHGCVGLSNADAAVIYDWAPVGTTLNIHD
jgi:lipoprotein-anchoring transpeptidase ErfK/SrfK